MQRRTTSVASVGRPRVKANPELMNDVIRRSRNSLTAASGRTKMTKLVFPQPVFSSGYAWMPLTAREQILVTMAQVIFEPG